jgi:hypothetical protein
MVAYNLFPVVSITGKAMDRRVEAFLAGRGPRI